MASHETIAISEKTGLGYFSLWTDPTFITELIPVAPANATDWQGTLLTSHGKCPARRLPSGCWAPLRDWQKGGSTTADLSKYAGWGANVGLLARHFPACDIDVYNEAVAEDIKCFAFGRLGIGPVRRGNDPKLLIVFSGVIDKRKLTFQLPDDERTHCVEFLGSKQQYVVDGVHPKTGRPYRWDNDERPIPDQLSKIDQEQVESWLSDLAQRLTAKFSARILGSDQRKNALNPERIARLKAFADRLAEGGGLADFLDQYARPGLKEDTEAMLRTSAAVANLTDGVEVHDNTYHFGRDGALNGLSESETLGLCEWVMQDCPHPDWDERHADMPRCVTDGYEKQLKIMSEHGALGDRLYFAKLTEVEDEFGVSSPEAMQLQASFRATYTEADRLDYADRRRRALNGPANDNLANETDCESRGLAVPTEIMLPLGREFAATLTAREWVYGHHYTRGYMGVTISDGGLGKSTLVLCETLAIATGRTLLGTKPAERTPVFYFNSEDPADEIMRRIAALQTRYEIKVDELDGWFFYGSGRDMPLLIADQDRSGVKINQPLVEKLIAEALSKKVGVIVLDPLVSVHAVEENSNGAVDQFIKRGLAPIAQRTNCAIELVHHTRKSNGQPASGHDARGAGALYAAARSVRMLSRATAKECTTLGISEEQAWRHVRLDNAKSNMSPPAKADWYKLASVSLELHSKRGGGTVCQSVQVIECWTPPRTSFSLTPEGIAAVAILIEKGCNGLPWRENSQAYAWVGHAIRAVLLAEDPTLSSTEILPSSIKSLLGSLKIAGILKSKQQKVENAKVAPCIIPCENWDTRCFDPDMNAAAEIADRATQWLTENLKIAA